MGEFKYYDWNKTLSYDAPMTVVVSERGLGKTYGLRKQCVKDFIKTGEPWIELCRFINQIPDVQEGYFDKFEEMGEFPGWVFKTEACKMYMAPKPEDEQERPDWRLCGYFLALSNWQNDKKRTFKRPRRIIFDEFLIDRSDRFHKYLPNEYTLILNVYSTTVRPVPGEDCRSRIYLLGNACDLVNPIFEGIGIDKPPAVNTFTWYREKSVLLHYCADKAHGEGMREGTVLGKLMKGIEGEGVMFDSAFEAANGAFVGQKPGRAKFDRAIVFEDMQFGIWFDRAKCFYYVTGQMPKGNGYETYALTKDDGTINRLMVKRCDPYLQGMVELHYANAVRYEDDSTRERFFQVLQWLGVK